MSPGCSVAIHVRTGMIILRIFFPPPSDLIHNCKAYMQELDKIEKTKLTCHVIELLPGEMMQVFFFLFYCATNYLSNSIIPLGIYYNLYLPVLTITIITYFLNYHCFHLSEISKVRMKFKQHYNLNCEDMAKAIYKTMFRMLYALLFWEKNCALYVFSIFCHWFVLLDLHIKPLFGLCKLVSAPLAYHYAFATTWMTLVSEIIYQRCLNNINYRWWKSQSTPFYAMSISGFSACQPVP